jgi:hypothetical protein
MLRHLSILDQVCDVVTDDGTETAADDRSDPRLGPLDAVGDTSYTESHWRH